MCFIHQAKGLCLFLAGTFLWNILLVEHSSVLINFGYYALLVLIVYHYCMSDRTPKVLDVDFQVGHRNAEMKQLDVNVDMNP